MAEKKAEKALENLKEQLKCAICLDTYTEPKLLTCSHVYCKDCLVKLVSRDQRGQSTLSCPNCRNVTPIPVDSGVAGLPPAFQTNNLLELQDSLMNVDHSSISKVAGQKQENDSAISTTTDPKASGKAISYCSEHPDKEIKLYCEDCSKFACVKCVIMDAEHHTHSHKMLDWYREQTASLLQPVKDQLAMIDSSLQKFDTISSDISNQRATLEANIDDIFGRIVEVLRIRRTELTGQLHQFTQRKLKALASQRDTVESMQIELQRCQESIEEKLKLCNEQEIVRIKDDSSKLINKLTSSFQPAHLKPSTVADMELSVGENLTSLCKSYGMLSTGEMLPDPSQCFITGRELESLSVETPAKITMQAITYWGEPCRESVKSSKFEFISDIITNRGVQGSLSRKSESQYELKVMPVIKGQHKLHLQVDGCPIRGSPFAVNVTSSPKSLCNPILSINHVLRPWGIAVSKKKEIILTENDKHCVSVFSLNGKKLRSFGSHGSDEGQFDNPRGIALDNTGNILVADHNNHRIQMFTADGQFLKAVGSKGLEPLQFEGPNAIAFNTCNGHFYVVDKTSRIQILSSQFAFCDSFGGVGRGGISLGDIGLGGLGFEGFGEGKLSPDVWGLCCDSNGLVHVADRASNQIKTYSSEGVLLKTIGKRFFGLFNDPVGVASDSNNLLYISNRVGDSVVVVTHDGKRVKEVGGVEKKRRQLDYPRGIVVDDCGVVYVCDNNNDRICMY